MDQIHFAIPESFFEFIFQVIGMIAASFMSIALVWLNRWLKAKAKITLFENEDLMRERLFAAIGNGVMRSVEKINYSDLTTANATIREKTMAYVKQTIPDTIKGLKITEEDLKAVVEVQIARAAQDPDHPIVSAQIPANETKPAA